MDLSLNQFIIELYRHASRMPLSAYATRTLAELREWLPFQSACLLEYQPEQGNVNTLFTYGQVAEDLAGEGELIHELCRTENLSMMPQVLTHGSLLGHQQHRLALRLSKCSHDGSYLIYPDTGDQPCMLLWLNRGTDDLHFTERDRLMAEWLLPHVTQAARLIALTDKYNVSLDVPAAASPLEIHLNSHNQVVWCGEYIRACISTCDNSEQCCFISDDTTDPVLSDKLIRAIRNRQNEGLFEINNLIFDVHLHQDICVLKVRPESIQNLLTRREQQIASHLALGLSYKEVARELSLSPSTITNYANRIYKKLNIHSKSQLAHLYTLSEAENLSKNVSC